LSSLVFKDILKIYQPDVTAVKDFNLEIEDKEFVVFVGPSGCGKSTVLRMVAGLEEITGGELYIGENLVNHIEPKNRNISMVFQNYALYPHLSVYKNMSFGLEVRKTGKAEIAEKVTSAAKLLGIEHLLERKPRALSGGEKQRVAIGRAIVRNPDVFLFDEPLSNLDAKLRTNMRKELIKLHKEIDTTFIYVTHDQIEAMTMADKIVIMDKGLIQQVGTPDEIYNNPANIFVADFVGTPSINIVDAVVLKRNDKYFLEISGNEILLDSASFTDEILSYYENKKIKAGIRPVNIHPATLSDNESCIIKGFKVNQIENTGAEQFIYGSTGGESLTVQSGGEKQISPNTTMDLFVDNKKIILFDTESGVNIGKS